MISAALERTFKNGGWAWIKCWWLFEIKCWWLFEKRWDLQKANWTWRKDLQGKSLLIALTAAHAAAAKASMAAVIRSTAASAWNSAKMIIWMAKALQDILNIWYLFRFTTVWWYVSRTLDCMSYSLQPSPGHYNTKAFWALVSSTHLWGWLCSPHTPRRSRCHRTTLPVDSFDLAYSKSNALYCSRR